MGMGWMSAELVRRALQNSGRSDVIQPPFSAADLAFLTHPGEPGNPASYWERIRGSIPYGPGASGPYAWQNDPGQWALSPEGTEILNLNRDVVRYVARFEDINWNDPRIRLPDSYLAARSVPELPSAEPAAPATPAPPPFAYTSSGGGGGGTVQPISYEPIQDDAEESALPVNKAGASFLDTLPSWAKLGLGVLGVALAMPIILPGKGRGRRARRR